MATADELLKNLTSQPDPEGHIVVRGDRFITVPANLKRLGVQYDHNMETVVFDCPRYWDNRDMSKMAVYINYIRSDGYGDRYPVDNLIAEDDVIHFEWTISRNVTAVAGNISFIVCVMKTDDEGNEEHHWNSEICKECYISNGMETDEHPALDYPDEVAQLLLHITTIENNIRGISIDDSTVSQKLWSSKNTVDKLCPAFTENGAIVTCEPVEGYPLGVVTRIEPVQSGSGDPYPPGGGKNLLENICGSGSCTGINYTVNEDGSITCTGTNTSNNAFWNINAVDDKTLTIAPGTYILSGSKDNVILQILVDEAVIATSIRGDEVTFTVPETATCSFCRANVTTANSVVNTTIYPMIRLATETDATYEPYSNIRPITGHTSCNLYRGGKNLFNDIGWFESHGFTKQSDGSWLGVSVDKNCWTNTAKKAGTVYITTIARSENPTGSPAYFLVYYTDGTYTSANNVQNYSTFTEIAFQSDPEKTVDYIKWTWGKSEPYYVKGVMISFVDNEYEPYKASDTFTAQLGQTVYGGSLDWKTGVLSVTHFTDVIDGAEKKFSGFGKVGEQVYCSIRLRYSIANNTDTLCSHLKYREREYSYGTYYVTDYRNDVMAAYIKAFADLNEANTWLTEQAASGTPFTVCYQLAEPITIQLTPQEVLALSGTNTLYSDTGDTVVTGRANPAAIIDKLTNAIIALGGNV
jgi:hypothetical protein